MPTDGFNAFISYARVDNQPLDEGQPGWVNTFVDRLPYLQPLESL